MNYLIAGANNYGNAGDDACAVSAAYIISRATNGTASTTITQPPFDEEKTSKADAVVLGGGGLFYDTVKENVDNYLSYLEYAQNNGLKSLVLGVGVQGLKTEWGKKRYRDVLKNCDLITVRSKEDKDTLNDIGVWNVIVTQDLGFLLQKTFKLSSLKIPLPRINRRPKVALSLFNTSFIQNQRGYYSKKTINGAFEYIGIVDKNMARLANEIDITFIVQSRDDNEWLQRLHNKYRSKIYVYKNPKDLNSLLKLIKKQDLVVTSRFHGMIFSILTGTPVAPLGFKNNKQEKLIKDYLPEMVDYFIRFEDQKAVSNYFSSGILDDVHKIINDNNFRKERTVSMEKVKELEAQAYVNVELIKKVINS